MGWNEIIPYKSSVWDSRLIHSFFPHYFLIPILRLSCCHFFYRHVQKNPHRVSEASLSDLPGLLYVGEISHKHGNHMWTGLWSLWDSSSYWATVQLSSRDKKRWIDGEDKKRLTHRGIVRPGRFQGSRCCHLLSLSVLASCLSAHSQNKPVHMSDLCSSLCLCACARPQKRVNASVRLTGLLSCARTVLQAGILMSLLGFSDWNRGM